MLHMAEHTIREVVVLGDAAELRDEVAALVARDGFGVIAATRLADASAVVLVDGRPSFGAGEQIADLVAGHPRPPVVVVSVDDRPNAVQGALRAGASGFVAHADLETALTAATQAAIAGQVTVPRTRKAEVKRAPLTAREKQTLGLVVLGLTNCEIANKLYLAESTVKSHLSSAFGKLGVRSRNEAAAMILDPRSGLGPGILTIPTRRVSMPT